MRALSCIRVGLVAGLLSCGGTEPQPKSGPPASLKVLAGGDQVGVVGEELPQALVVRVTDAQGEAVSGLLVNFVVTKGGGSVFAGSAQTTADGEARERWTLGPTAGEQILEARAVDQSRGDPIVFGRITATANHGPVARFWLTYSERKIFLNETLDLAPLVLEAIDQFGNAIANPPLTLEVPAPFTHEGTTVSSAVETKGSVGLRSEDATGAVEVTVVRHLSELVGATGGWACEGLYQPPLFRSLTRLEVHFVVDSVTYPALIEGSTRGGAALWVTRYETKTGLDGSTSTTGPTPEGLVVVRQEPELLVIGRWFGVGYVTLPQDVAQTSAAPLSYRGGSLWCYLWSPLDSFEPLTITR